MGEKGILPAFKETALVGVGDRPGGGGSSHQATETQTLEDGQNVIYFNRGVNY